MSNQLQKTNQNQQQVMPVAQSDGAALMEVISRAASDPSCDIVKMEKLLGMHERMMNRAAEVEFNGAMADMQAEIPSIAERGKGHNIVYATLEDIIDVVRPIMHKYGFAVSFEVSNTNEHMTVTGVLMHRSGHSMKTSMVLPADKSGSKNAVQAIGSSTSYGKRYVICALLNIATRNEDDNGFAAVPDVTISFAQAAELNALFSRCNPATQEKISNVCGDLESLPRSDFNKTLANLKKAVARDEAAKPTEASGAIEASQHADI